MLNTQSNYYPPFRGSSPIIRRESQYSETISPGIDDHRIALLEKSIQLLHRELVHMSKQYAELHQYLRIEQGEEGPHVVVRGANLQILNSPTKENCENNGLGNLIMGPNFRRNAKRFRRSGSHNIVIGEQNVYSGSYSIIMGRKNTSLGQHSFISGFKNFANADYTAMLSGHFNRAETRESCILGGWEKYSSDTQILHADID